MSRAFAALLLTLLTSTAALAQGPAPNVEPGTKLSFPATLGGATLERSASVRTGASYQYVTPNRMEVVVDVYGGDRRVPNGSSHPTIINQFSDELTLLQQSAAAAGLSGFEKPAAPSACTYGPHTFRCIVFSASSGSAGRMFGKFLLIGYREHLLKIVVQWRQKDGQTLADADKLLNAFVPALMR
jgi:hypothetical protein